MMEGQKHRLYACPTFKVDITATWQHSVNLKWNFYSLNFLNSLRSKYYALPDLIHN